MSRTPRAALPYVVATLLAALCVAAAPSTAGAATADDGVIAYVRAAPAGGYVIRGFDPRTGADRWLTRGTSPAWSPDGRRLAFISLSDSGAGTIRIRSADGSVRSTGVPAQFRDETTRNLAWSPDGTRLAYGHGDRIWVMSAASPHRPRAVSPGLGYAPVWSPDSRRILYSGSGPGGVPDLHRVRADGTRHVNVTRTADATEHFADWSPDGTHIAYYGDTFGGEVGVYLSNPDGSDPDIIGTSRRDHSPSWAPSGGRIAFIGEAGYVCWREISQNVGGCSPVPASPALQVDWQPRRLT